MEKLNNLLRRLLSIALLWICIGLESKVAVSQVLVPITTTDGSNTAIDTFGVHIDGSYCLDGCLAPALCEEELPPSYFLVFDARFIESRHGSSCVGVGTRLNLQDGTVGEPDTFLLSILQPDTDGYPITLTWRVVDLDGYVHFTSMWMSDSGGGSILRINMLSDSTTSFSDRRVKVLQIITTTDIDGDVEDEASSASEYRLFQNYPNPFNPNTTISYRLATSDFIRISIYDNLGRVVSVLDQGRKSPGIHRVQFDATMLPAGIYLARLVSGSYSKSIKLLYLK
jgi:hypothetical protein